jgi:hypothetical protein
MGYKINTAILERKMGILRGDPSSHYGAGTCRGMSFRGTL